MMILNYPQTRRPHDPKEMPPHTIRFESLYLAQSCNHDKHMLNPSIRWLRPETRQSGRRSPNLTSKNGRWTRKVIPNFRDAAAAALGERWASTPPGWFEPRGDKPSFFHDDDSSSRSKDGEDENSGRGRSRNGGDSHAPETPPTPATLGRRARAAATAKGSREADVGAATPLPTTPPQTFARKVATPPAPGTASKEASKADGAKPSTGDEASKAPFAEPCTRDGGSGGGGGGDGRISSAGGARENIPGNKERPYTTERNNAKDLAQYLGVSGPDNDSGSGGAGSRGRGVRGGGKRGVGGLMPGEMDEYAERNEEDGEGQVRGI